MTDNEIVKALEYCKEQGITSECEKCNIKEDCRRELVAIALDLINRQKAEIENLYHNLKCEKDHKEKLIEQSKLQRAEIERLQSMNQAKLDTIHDLMTEVESLQKQLKEGVDLSDNVLKIVKSEAIKEFTERICKDRVSNDPVVIAVKAELKMVGTDD